jgi:hypothetical protein
MWVKEEHIENATERRWTTTNISSGCGVERRPSPSWLSLATETLKLVRRPMLGSTETHCRPTRPCCLSVCFTQKRLDRRLILQLAQVGANLDAAIHWWEATTVCPVRTPVRTSSVIDHLLLFLSLAGQRLCRFAVESFIRWEGCNNAVCFVSGLPMLVGYAELSWYVV